jgi:RNA polymerase sigma-70 factor (ECF subfamily)
MTQAKHIAAADSAEEMARPESIEELFTALESPLLAYALRLLGEREAAEDVVQDAFMKLHGQFAEVRDARRWLFRTVHNLALNHRRDASKVVRLAQFDTGEEAPTAAPDLSPDEAAARVEGVGMVRASLGALDERSRELVRLKFDENLSYQQISERTGLTVGNVGYVLHHALKTIAGELARTGLLP